MVPKQGTVLTDDQNADGVDPVETIRKVMWLGRRQLACCAAYGDHHRDALTVVNRGDERTIPSNFLNALEPRTLQVGGCRIHRTMFEVIHISQHAGNTLPRQSTVEMRDDVGTDNMLDTTTDGGDSVADSRGRSTG